MAAIVSGVSTHPSSRSASGNRAPSGNSSRPRPVHAERPFNRENQIDEVESVRAEAVDEPRLEGNLGFIEGKAVGDHRQCYTEGVGGRFCYSPLDAAKVLPWEEPKTRDDQPRIYEQMVLHWARDMSFVIDRLTELNNGSQGLFAGRLDLARVGTFGHSRGGQAAGTVRLLDARIRGAINLDGNIRGRGFQPIKGPDGGQQPFMWIEKQTPVLNDKELEQAQLPKALYQEFFAETTRLMQSVKGGSAHVTVARLGIEHLDFSDNPFWGVAVAPDVRAAKRQTVALTRAYVRAFFDGCLRGQWGELRELTAEASKAYPEVSSRTFGRMWPN
jgi:hypothetical protein